MKTRSFHAVVLLLASSFAWILSNAEASPYEDAIRATARIKSAKESGTAFFVKTGAQHHLITASHVFTKMEGDTCSIVYRKKKESGGFERAEVNLQIRKDKKPLWQQHEDLDLAVIKVNPPDNVDLKPFEYDQIGDVKLLEDQKIAVGLDIFVPCYPAKIESNPAGWPILRRGSIASYPLLPLKDTRTFMISSFSYGGESGAPCVALIDGKVVVAGVVFAMQRQTDKVSSPFLESTMHTPMGLGIVVQAPFVRELIAGND